MNPNTKKSRDDGQMRMVITALSNPAVHFRVERATCPLLRATSPQVPWRSHSPDHLPCARLAGTLPPRTARLAVPPNPIAWSRLSAFSLIEMIGVVAILAVIAAVLLPPMIKHTDEATRTRERASLGAISDALELNAIRSNSIPALTNWMQAAANWSAVPAFQIATNARRYPRVYFLRTGPNPALGYTQNTNGTSRPSGLQAVVVSILGGDSLTSANCPSPNGGYLSDADFDALWKLKDRQRPTTGLWANWNGTGDDFLVQQVNYGPLFHHLVLVNRDTNSPSFRINGSDPIWVPNNPNNNVGWDSYYLDGTVVGLGDNAGTNMTRYVLKRDIGFVFEAQPGEPGLWRDQIAGLNTGNTNADNFGEKAADFLGSQWYTGAFQGADQQSALVAMYSFMYTYTLWANQCPHFPWHNPVSNDKGNVPEYQLLQSATGDAANDGLDEITGQNGLLK